MWRMKYLLTIDPSKDTFVLRNAMEEFYNVVSTNTSKVEWETERFALRVVAGKSVSNSFVT